MDAPLALLALQGSCATGRAPQSPRMRRHATRSTRTPVCSAHIRVPRTVPWQGPGVFPLHKLPSELRIRILSLLAPHLDDTQTTAVLSWACCAATMGFCCKRRADPRPPLAPTLDVPPWDWDNCSTCGSHFGPKPYAVSDISSVSNLAAFLESTGTNVASMNHWYTYGR